MPLRLSLYLHDDSLIILIGFDDQGHRRGIAVAMRRVAEAMPYADAIFDVVVRVDVLEHVTDVKAVLSEIQRTLKPGGFFFFDTINRTWKSRLMMIWFLENMLREIPQGIHDWRKFITPQELTQWMQTKSFESIEIMGFDLFGEALKLDLKNYKKYKRVGSFDVKINNDTSIMYIGKAVKKG